MDASEWDARYSAAESLWSFEPNRFLVAEVADLPPGTALDLACGEGRNAVWLAERGWTVTAVDFSPVAVDRGRHLADARGVEVNYVLDDVVAHRPDEGAFDLVLILYLHLPADELTPVLRAAAEAVATGGTLLLVGHDRDNLEHGYGGPQDPALLWDAAGLVATLDGLEVEKAGQVRRPVETEDGEQVAIDTLVRARRSGVSASS
jgi:SAM-dependent methyltransferase